MRFRAFLYAFVPAFFLVTSALAQFDTEYWMPPVWESRDEGLQGYGGRTAPTELVITTAYSNAAVAVTLADGTLVERGNAQPGIPFIVELSATGDTNPPRGMTFNANAVEGDKGLRITSDFPVQVVYRNTSIYNQCLAPLKGTFALGEDFIAGSQTRVTNNKYGKDDIHFISVMATEDGTQVSLVAPGPYFATASGPESTATVTLNKNETYLVRNNNQGTLSAPGSPQYAGNNLTANLAGTRITSDQPIAVMTGGQHLRYDDGNPNPDDETDADAGIDQAVPITSDIFDMIGTEYVIVRGGTELIPDPADPTYEDRTDYAIIIPTEDNTVVRVNGNEVATIATAGEIYEYTLPGGSAALGTPFYIETDKKTYLYHVSGLQKHELGMSAVPTINCAGSQYLAFNRFDNPDPSVTITDPQSYDNTINIIATATAFQTLKINDDDYSDYLADAKYNFSGLETVPGRDDWRTATFNFPKDDPENMTIRSEGFFHVGVVVGSIDGGTYGYLSSFARKVDVLDPNLFPQLRIPTPIYRVGSLAPGDTLTHCLELVSCDPDHYIESIAPSANTGDAFRQGEIGEPEDVCLRYVAKPDYAGNDTVTVIVRNGEGIPGRVRLVFEVVPLPVTVDDVLKTGPQDQPLPFATADFSDRFFDAEGGSLTTVQVVSLPDTGSLTLEGAPVAAGQEIAVVDISSLVYTPPPGYADTVRFDWNGSNGTTYAAEPAEVIITLVNDDNVFSVRDSTYTVDRNTAYDDDLSSNVDDPGGAGFTFTTDPLTGPQNGTITLNPDGTFTYTPNADFFGRDSVVYEVCPTANPTGCAQATAYFEVRIPEDDPTDTDDDGIPDGEEVGEDQNNPTDTDDDGTPDYLDEDSDNDTIPDDVEAGTDPTNPVDTDGDGQPDYRDLDSDNDTIPDEVEAGDDPTNPVDTDNDGTPDFRDTNSDNDSLTDAEEAGPDPNNPQDTDDDGLPDYRDVDQGITIYEGFSPGGTNETWIIDGIQAFPNNTVQVFNRWGNKVYEVDGYDNVDRVWRGDSNVSSLGGNEVPDGTYFYIVDLGEGDPPRTGYVVVNR